MTCECDQSWGLTVGQGGSVLVTLLVLGWILRMYWCKLNKKLENGALEMQNKHYFTQF